jgi:glycosyltransferase involved in cell wall biosynthesis
MTKAKLKVVLTCHQFFPRHCYGTERYTLELAKSLQRVGHEVLVVTTSRWPEDSSGSGHVEYSFEGVRVIAINIAPQRVFWVKDTYDRPEHADLFHEILLKERPEVVHFCHFCFLGANLIPVARQLQLPIAMTLTDFFAICWKAHLSTLEGHACIGPDPDGMNCLAHAYLYGLSKISKKMVDALLFASSPVPTIWKRLALKAVSGAAARVHPMFRDISLRHLRIRQFFSSVDRFVVATDCMKEAFIRSGYPEERFKKIGFGITQPVIAEKTALKERYEKVSPFVFGFIGQVAANKGIDLLVKAFREVNLPDTELHIYGDLGLEKAMRKIVQRAAESDPRIKCLGTFPGEQIYEKLASIHVLCIPSIWSENSPLVLLNALASKTFVIISDGKGLTEFVDDGVQGLVFSSGSVQGLANAMSQAYQRRSALGHHTRTLPVYAQNPGSYGQQIEEIYYQLLREASGNRNGNREPLVGDCRR